MKLFDNFSLKRKITASFLAAILFTLSILAVSVDMFFTRKTTDLADRYTLQGIEQVITGIESHIKNTESLIDLISKDSSILEFLSWKNYHRSSSDSTRSNVRNILTNVVDNSDDILGIVVANSNNFYISNEMYYDSDEAFIAEGWYKNCMENGALTVFSPEDDRAFKYYYSPGTRNIISIAKPIYLPNSTISAGTILVDINIDFMSQILDNTSWDKTGFVFILGNEGDIIYSPATPIVPRIKYTWFDENDSAFKKKIFGHNYEFVFAKSKLTQWTAVGVFSLNNTLKPIYDFRIFTIFIFIMAVLSATFIVTVISRTIVNPVQTLNGLMRKASSGDLDVRFNARSMDEIGELGRSFNTMVEEIKNLIEINKNEQRSKRRAELQILQEQIKPHFLYNTFDTIHWIAKKYGATEIVDIVHALTVILRVGLSRGRDCISVEDELKHAVGYLTIQKIRYGDKLTYKIIMQDGCEKYFVQKLILQPLIENALYHGVKTREDGGKLTIKINITDSEIVFTVVDNGGGIEPDRLKQLLDSLENNNSEHLGYGVFNVNERIRISYGQQFGIKIFTKFGYYTKVEIHHPLILISGEGGTID